MVKKPRRNPAGRPGKPRLKPLRRAARGADAKLLGLRRRIDTLDDKLIALLKERIGIVAQVAKLKAAHWPSSCHIRPGREGEMHRRIAARFKDSNFPPRAALFLWRQIIGSSTTHESPLRIAYLMAHPAHYWLAREYFGPMIGLTAVAAPSLVEPSNILVLPAPETPGVEWWRHPMKHHEQPLRLFARLPLLDEELPDDADAAVALAAIAPEPSGDDISYFVIKTKSPQDVVTLTSPARVIALGNDYLVIADGFVAPGDDLPERWRKALGNELVEIHWWGAHPRPLVLAGGEDA